MYEDGGNGEVYPARLRGRSSPSWVVDVVPAHFDPDGTFWWGPAR